MGKDKTKNGNSDLDPYAQRLVAGMQMDNVKEVIEKEKREKVLERRQELLNYIKDAQDSLVTKQADLLVRGKGFEELSRNMGKLLEEIMALKTKIEGIDLGLKASTIEKKIRTFINAAEKIYDKVEVLAAEVDDLLKKENEAKKQPSKSEKKDGEHEERGLIFEHNTLISPSFVWDVNSFIPNCDVSLEDGIFYMIGKGDFSEMSAEIKLNKDQKSLAIKIMKGAAVAHEEKEIFALGIAGDLLRNYFVKKPAAAPRDKKDDASDKKPASKKQPAVTIDVSRVESDAPKKIDNLASHAPTVMVEPEPKKEPAKPKAEKFVLENGIAKVGDIAIDLSALVNDPNYKVTLTKNGSVRIEDLRSRGKHKAIFQFDETTKKIDFKPMDRGKEYDTMSLDALKLINKLTVLFPELKGEEKRKDESVEKEPAVVSPFKLEGENLSTANFTWDLHNILDGGQCEVVLEGNYVIFQGKEGLDKIRFKVRLTENKDEVEMKKEVDGKKEFDQDYKIKNALDSLERTFANKKKSEARKVVEKEPIAPPTKVETETGAKEGFSSAEEKTETNEFIEGVITEKRLKKLKEILEKSVIEQNIFSKMATTAAIGLPRVEVGAKEYEAKKRELKDKPEQFAEYEAGLADIETKRSLLTKEEFADFVRDTEAKLADTFWRWHKMPRSEKDKQRERQDKWFKSVQEYLQLKVEEKKSFDSEAMDIYNDLRSEFDALLKDVQEHNGEIMSHGEKTELRKEFLVKLENINKKIFSASEELEEIEDGEMVKQNKDYFAERISKLHTELREIMVNFDHEVEKSEPVSATAKTVPSTPPPAAEGESVPEIKTEEERIVEVLHRRAPEINAAIDEYEAFADFIKATIPNYYYQIAQPSVIRESILGEFEKIAKETKTVEEVERKIDELLNAYREYKNNVDASSKIEYDKIHAVTAEPASAGEDFTFGGPVAPPVIMPSDSRMGIPASISLPTVTPVKKSFWGKAKEFFGKKEKGQSVGWVAAEMAYKTMTSILGVKSVTDLVGLGAGKIFEKYGFGWGDMHKMRMGAKEIKSEKSSIRELMDQVAASGDALEAKMAELSKKIEASEHISRKDKQVLYNKLHEIADEYQKTAGMEKAGLEYKAKELLEIFMQNKVSKMTIAKDALNTLLTATGMSMVRGAVYTATSIGERVIKGRREYDKKTAIEGAQFETKTEYALRDLIVNSTRETARSLLGLGAEKGKGFRGRAIDFVRAAGTVARGFGIAGLALADTATPGEAVSDLIEKIQEQGIMCAIKENFFDNAARAWQVYTHPGATASAIWHRFFGHGTEAGPAMAGHHIVPGAEQVAVAAAAEQISPDLQAHLDKFGDNQTLREAFLAEAHAGHHTPEEITNAFTVHKGDGLERIIERQLLLDPEKFGLHDQNILGDPDKLQHWAGHEARIIAVKNHIDDKYFVYDAKHPQYLVVDENKNVIYEAKQLHAETEGMRGHRAGVEEVKPEAPKPVLDEQGEARFMTDAEKYKIDKLFEEGKVEEAADKVINYHALGPVYELPDGTQTHESNLVFDNLTHGGVAPTHESVINLTGQTEGPNQIVVGNQEQLAQELKTPEIFRGSAPAEHLDAVRSSVQIAREGLKGADTEELLKGIHVAGGVAEHHASLQSQSGASVKFKYDKDTGEPSDMNITASGHEKFGDMKGLLLRRSVGESTFGTSSKMSQLRELNAADEVYRKAVSDGLETAPESVLLKKHITEMMSGLSKTTGKPNVALFQNDVLKRYGFEDEAKAAGSYETARNALDK